MIRIGHGFDVHSFGGHGPLTIGGVKVDYEQGFIAHSDGDVAIHALCDALLGAMAMGDIGKHFPDTSEEFAGIDSRILLRRVMAEVHDRAFVVANVDLTIVAQAPKMRPHIDAMRACLAADLAVSLDQVNVKATTTEKLGFTGRKEGIAAHAVALLVQQP
ncbi:MULTISPECIES: 2-C-methyl-D-erythritol 2,4-cyclodiphosphate synthase [unclassified Pseudoalteromonas]|uniref:2-C-methyl-D-erythritol 2,4-cyclodiphosphate synthase n=1 Tax=unclassified Pseudoalteromonas TaxID=194690 RepID=UPI000CF65C76|nr:MULTISPECIES: 2-C-methyl-D-erythritol 2,4-cyclodiphosphate synthase [unclassified Pseudoalteromonas]